MFFIFSLILMVYDWVAAIAALDSDADMTCDNNVFDGTWQPLNALNYYCVRVVAGLSANFAMLYLFWKKKVQKGVFDYF